MTRRSVITNWDEVPIIIDIPYASRLLGRTPENIRVLCAEELLPAFKVGTEWRINKEELHKFMATGGSRDERKAAV